MNHQLSQLLNEKIVYLDGAMGTMIQQYELTEEDFKGEKFENCSQDLKGNNDILSITKPEIIQEIHKQYLLNEHKRKTKLTKAFSGRLARGIVNKYIQEMENKSILPFPAQNTLTTPLRRLSIKKNNGEFINLWAGKNFHKITSLNANDLVMKLKEELKD